MVMAYVSALWALYTRYTRFVEDFYFKDEFSAEEEQEAQPEGACDLKEKEEELDRREAQLLQREEQISNREAAVAAREAKVEQEKKMEAEVIVMVVVVKEEDQVLQKPTQPCNKKTEKLAVVPKGMDATVAVKVAKPPKMVRKVKTKKTVQVARVEPKAGQDELVDSLSRGTRWAEYMDGLAQGVAIVQRPENLPTSLRKKKPIVCRNFQSGWCKFGADCMFLHQEQET